MSVERARKRRTFLVGGIFATETRALQGLGDAVLQLPVGATLRRVALERPCVECRGWKASIRYSIADDLYRF